MFKQPDNDGHYFHAMILAWVVLVGNLAVDLEPAAAEMVAVEPAAGERTTVGAKSGAKLAAMSRGAIRFDHVSFSYKGNAGHIRSSRYTSHGICQSKNSHEAKTVSEAVPGCSRGCKRDDSVCVPQHGHGEGWWKWEAGKR